jgi:hypothetical protein
VGLKPQLDQVLCFQALVPLAEDTAEMVLLGPAVLLEDLADLVVVGVGILPRVLFTMVAQGQQVKAMLAALDSIQVGPMLVAVAVAVQVVLVKVNQEHRLQVIHNERAMEVLVYLLQ